MDSLLINKIFENIKKNDIFPGCIVASVSKERPNYYYHWTRDAALVMRSIIKYFKLTKDLKCFKQIIDYLNVESRFQKLSTLSGLGEPKYNVDLTSFNDTWGRPQNDGPALRGLIMLELYRLLEDYPFLLEQVSKIILNDLNYVLQNINQPSFDLWEEVYGYHLYTRGVQYKFLKEVLVSDIFPDLQENIIMGKNSLKELISHHQITMTSFDTNGKSCREYDTSLLLLVNHIDYDRDVVDILDPIFIDYIKRMIASGNLILDNDVIITYNYYKRKQRVGTVTAQQGDCILHQIAAKNKGTASQTLQNFFNWTNRRVFLSVRSDNQIAKKFYEKNGMDLVGFTSWSKSGVKDALPGDVYMYDNVKEVL